MHARGHARRSSRVNGRHAETNPILERIDQIHDVWTAFVQQPASRLLIWLMAENEASLIDAFVGHECDAATAKTPDVFVQLQAPFAGAGYGDALAHELVSNYRELTDLAEPRWRAPKWSAREDDVQARNPGEVVRVEDLGKVAALAHEVVAGRVAGDRAQRDGRRTPARQRQLQRQLQARPARPRA